MHKKLISLFMAGVLALSLTMPVFAVPEGTGTEVYQNTAQLAQGLTYTNTIYTNSTYGREESFALELAPDSDVFPMVMACDTIYGGMSISNCIAYAESLGYNVVAAVNTDYFNSVKVPLGMVVENGVYKSSPSGQNAVAFLPDGETLVLEAPEVTITLTNHGSDTDTTRKDQNVTLNNFNKMRTASGGLYLFSEAFSTVSTRSSGDGWSVRFRILEGEMTVSGTVELEVEECIEGSAPVTIGEGCLVLTADALGGLRGEFEKFAVGDKVTLQTLCSDPALAAAEQVMGCGDILVSGGQVTDRDNWDSDISGVNPRTVLGVKSDGTLVLYVVDGRQSGYSNGISLEMLAKELKSEGCTYGVNLDGGGSSAMSIRLPGSDACTVVNSPSDGQERSGGAYLLLVTEKEKTGRAEMLHLTQDGTLILAGSSLELSVLARDAGLYTAETPTDVTVRATRGTVTNGVYFAPTAGGTDAITLRSPATGAAGTGTLHVLEQVSGLSVKNDKGENVAAINLKSGETMQLIPAVYQYARAVVSTPEAYTYVLTGEVGTVSETGLFTAGTQPGATGVLTVSGGGQSVTIPVKVTVEFTDVKGTWAEPYVTYLQELGIVSGTTATTFSPDANIKRGDFMLMLYNAAGKPEVTEQSTFTDVAATDYYAPAIAWAQSKGIAAGTGDGTFLPTQSLTREQAFAFAFRALGILEVEYLPGDLTWLEDFADTDDIAEYARTPAATLVSLGVVSGSDGKISPKDDLTRAQMARILYSVLELA